MIKNTFHKGRMVMKKKRYHCQQKLIKSLKNYTLFKQEETMDFDKNTDTWNRGQQKKYPESLGIRAFKSMGRKGFGSPKIGGYQNKQNAKNIGNWNSNENDKQNKNEQGSKEEVRNKSSNRMQKKPLIGNINTNSSFDKPDLSALHSNKANIKLEYEQNGFKKNEKRDNIITEGISKDGQYQVTSRAIYDEELKKAVQLQHKMNLRAKKAAIKQMSSVMSPKQSNIMAEPSKTSNKENGIIKAYAVNTHQGISRNYNEDRVSIILNISKNGIKSAYFAVYDGHGGSSCCDFLSEHLHQYILNSKKFPSHPRQAIIEGMRLAEQKFLQQTKSNFNLKQQLDRSGSCALIALVVGNDCFIANLGDSRAVLSTCKGKPLYSLSRDHKPTDSNEQARILKEGGKIYRTQMQKIQKNENLKKKPERPKSSLTDQNNQLVIGPLRVFPGKLSVTRTFGDIEAKLSQFGGIKNCIGTDPQICKYTLNGKQDFILLGCDGIFQRMDSEEVIEEAWKHLKKANQQNLHQYCGIAAQGIVNTCMRRKSMDNLTVILIYLGSMETNANIAEYRSV